jgi:hypothetical protein
MPARCTPITNGTHCSLVVYDFAPESRIVDRENCRAAIKIHGIFSNTIEAQNAIRKWANEHPDVDAFVIEKTDSWIRVHSPKDGAHEVEEIPTSENDDPSHGRHGSVCNIRNSTTGKSKSDTDAVASSIVMESVDTPVAKKKAVQTQCMQLDALLSFQPSEDQVRSNQTDYNQCREQFATLNAFERKLKGLHTASLEKCNRVATEIASLDQREPTYQTQYRVRYEEALRGSGIDPDGSVLMQFIGA